MNDDSEAIRNLARACPPLPLRYARGLFDRLIAADALLLEKGNVSKAAKRLGVRREWVIRAFRSQ